MKQSGSMPQRHTGHAGQLVPVGSATSPAASPALNVTSADLLAFAQTIPGFSQSIGSGWMDASESACSWASVLCSQGQITGLNVSDMQFSNSSEISVPKVSS